MSVNKNKDYADTGFFFYIFTAAVTIIMFFVSFGLEKSSDKPAMFSDKWFYDAELTAPADMKHPSLNGGKCSFFAAVPDSMTVGDCIWFKAKNAFISVKVGGEQRAEIAESEYSYLYGKTPGTDWVCVPLERADAGKLIRIDFRTNYADKSAYIDSVLIGSAAGSVRYAFADRIVGTVLCIIIMLTGVILLTVYFILARYLIEMPKELLYLGVCVIFASLWSFSELRVFQLFTDKNAGVFYNLTCMSLMLIIMPLVYYYKSDIDRRSRYIIPAMTALAMIDFAVTSILHFTGIADYHETLTLTHITLGIGAVLVIYANFMRCFVNPDRTKADIPPAVCMILIGVATVADIFRYKGGGINDSAFYSRMGIIAFSVSLAVRSLVYVVDMVKLGVKSDIISRLAYEDGLTGLGNRTAYSEALDEIKGRETTVFVFDINNLKYVNDNLGHSSGDKLIMAGASVISSVFGNIGKCYRTGGDEFICLAEGAADGEELTRKFYERIAEFNKSGKLDFTLAVAMGYEKYSGGDDFKEVIDSADKKMYLKKAALKAEAAAPK